MAALTWKETMAEIDLEVTLVLPKYFKARVFLAKSLIRLAAIIMGFGGVYFYEKDRSEIDKNMP